MAEIHVDLPDAAATKSLGARLSSLLPPAWNGLLLLLQGELGAGKSTLARAMLHRLGHEGAVPSPTYTLVEPYELAGGTVYHVDLYRLSGIEDLDYLGWNDMRDGLVLLEWPEREPQLRQQADLLIELRYDGEARSATLSALSASGVAILDRYTA